MIPISRHTIWRVGMNKEDVLGLLSRLEINIQLEKDYDWDGTFLSVEVGLSLEGETFTVAQDSVRLPDR